MSVRDMWMSLIRVSLIGRQSDYVRDFMGRGNLEALQFQTVIVIALSAMLLVSSFLPIPPWVGREAGVLVIYRIGFSVLALLNLVVYLLRGRYSKEEPLDLHKVHALLLIYTLTMISLGIGLCLFDYPHTESFFAFVSVLVLTFGLLYIPPVHTVVILVLSITAMIIGLDQMGFNSFLVRVTLYAYVVLVAFASGSTYVSRFRAGQASEVANRLVYHDELTGVCNRRAFEERTHAVLGTPLYLLIGDIDEFKFYNDSFGHAAGDRMLVAFAETMEGAFGFDNIYRYGGDEFVVILPYASQWEFDTAVAKWRRSFIDVEIDGERYSPTTSGGYVYGTPETEDEFKDMFRIADIKLYDAKQEGRNRVLGISFDEARSAGSSLLTPEHQRRAGDLDPLTGLPAMMYFAIHAKTVLESPALTGMDFHFVYFNVENLTIYNERFGLSGGDELLIFLAHTIESSFEHSLVSRFGDDRFVLLTYGDDLMQGIERVHNAVKAYNPESQTEIRAGIYTYDPDEGIEVSAACDRAKLACDHIRGRYNVSYFLYTESLLAARNRQQFILDRLEDAMETGNIQVYYQPIVRCIGERVCEVEALARWIDEDKGVISPADFIEVLEEFRLIHRMDIHILNQVCRDYRAMTDSGIVTIPANVNLSRYDLELCDIVAEVESAMRRYDVPPHMLHIEITESAFAENQELLRTTIDRFHELGLQVWMDDFGSGYSSLNVLREFGFDVVKIDLRFLNHQSEESQFRARQMVPHLIGMIKELGIQTLAEGVETREQFEFLKEIGCEKVQGFAFGKPAPLGDPDSWIATWSKDIDGVQTRSYYDAIGQVNLMRPTGFDMQLSHEIELASGLPAAIIEFRGDTVRYLANNASYLDYLHDIGMDSLQHSEDQMNDLSRIQSRGFFDAASRLKGTDEWLNLSFYEGNDLCTAMARCIGVDDSTGASAFVYIAFNVGKFVNRSGYSIPKK